MLTGYEYRQGAYQLSGGERTWSDWTAVPSPEEALPTSLTLSVGSCTTYYFEVRARNAAVSGDSVRVFGLAPKWSGSLSSDTTWSGAVCVDGEVTIPSGVTLSLGSGTEASFSPGALIVSGTLGAGTGVTFRSSNAVSPSPSAWSGIRVESGGSADLSGATIRDGAGCVQAHTSALTTVTMTNATLSNCDQTVSLDSRRPQVGVELTASLAGVSSGQWQWEGRNEGDSAPAWSDLSGLSPSASYTPVRADLGQKLRATVKYVPDAGSYSRFVQSEPTREVMLPSPTGFEVWPDHESVLLKWDDPDDVSITHWGYGKRKGTAPMEWTQVTDGSVASLEYEGRTIRYIRVVENLTNGEEYLFKVRAKSADAEGVPTDPVRVMPVQPTVAYGASSYEAQEGGEPVPVSVSLSSKATRAVALPVTVTADAGTESGDYAVAGLTTTSDYSVSPCTLDVVLITFEDTSASAGRYDYHDYDLPHGYTRASDGALSPGDSSYTMDDFKRMFSGGYDYSVNGEAPESIPAFTGTGQIVSRVNDNDTVTDTLPEVFGSLRHYFHVISGGFWPSSISTTTHRFHGGDA